MSNMESKFGLVTGQHRFTISSEQRKSVGRGEVVKSDEFSIPSLNTSRNVRKWKLGFVFESYCEPEDKFYRELHLESLDQEETLVFCRLSVLRRDGAARKISCNRKMSFTKNSPICKTKLFYELLDLANYSWDLQTDGSLIIVCDLEVFFGLELTSDDDSKEIVEPQKTVGDDLSFLLQDCQFSDVTLICQSATFAGHKNILAARSDVFRAMFSHQGFVESSNRVEIHDMDAESLKSFLTFVYTDKISDEDLSKSCNELFVAADKYNVAALKAICERHMIDNISGKNAAVLATLAHKHSCFRLKQSVFEFIRRERRREKEIQDWGRIRQCPQLVQELMDAFMGVKID